MKVQFIDLQQRFEEEMDRQERQEADEIAQGLRRYSVQ